MPSALAQRSTSVCSKRLSASATPSALVLPEPTPQTSFIELDWSTRKTKQVGLVRLISALYGMTPFPSCFLESPSYHDGKRSGGGLQQFSELWRNHFLWSAVARHRFLFFFFSFFSFFLSLLSFLSFFSFLLV